MTGWMRRRKGEVGAGAPTRGPTDPTVSGHGVVEVEALARSFPGVTALDGLSFQVGPGELFGVVGPDGAGKTTLLRILAGVLPPSAGDARILGRSVARDPEAVKPHIAYMAQRFGLYEDLTVRENLDFYADLYRVPPGERAVRMERLYHFSRLEPFQHRLAGALSGGMKQKLSLSCSLIHHPRVLLLDEPTFGVDPISRRDLWLILHRMVEEGVTVVVSTAYMDEAERCDRILLLHQGKALELGTPAALLGALPGVLLAVRGAEPRRARDLLRAHPGVWSASLFGENVHVLIREGGEWEGIRDSLAAQGVPLQEATPLEPTLEDLFIHRVEEEATARG